VAIPAVGSKLAGYRIDGLIGRGGMGVVYRGTDVRLGRPVAIKLIAAERAGEPGMRERFEREARLMAAIDHPNVVPVYAAGEDDGCLYLVMRYVAGTDLGALLQREGRLDPARAVHITTELAAGLDAAHAAGLIHRDIKPANVLLAGDQVFLGDFGLGRAVETATRLTDSNDWLGTVDFCSPEQLRCERIDARSDVYSLGCLLHTALTGTPPLHRATAASTMLAQLNDAPPLASRTPGVPTGFDRVLARALAKRPEDRYATAGELARAASRAVAPSPPGPSRPGDDTAPSHRRREGAPPEETMAARTRRLPLARRTKLDLRPRRPSSAERELELKPGASRRGLFASLALLAAVAAAVGVLAAGGRARPPGPLTRGEMTRVVQSFASAYGHRDTAAVASLLAAGVARADTGSIERGRSAVLSEYQAELADPSIVGYRLTGVTLTPGWTGRATARYAVLRIARPTLTGQVTFGIERIAGRPRIALIAIQPTG
jgi:serine/threonine-protein kinase